MKIAPKNELNLTNMADFFGKRYGNVNVDRMFEQMGISGYSGRNKYEKIKDVLLTLYHTGEFDKLKSVINRMRGYHSLMEEEMTEIDSYVSNLDFGASRWGAVIPEIRTPEIDIDTTEAREMSGAYVVLHVLENELRKFVEEMLKEKFGNDWWEKGTSRDVKDGFRRAKEAEEKSHWQITSSVSEIYYTDFSHLKRIISKNWDIFEEHFADQMTVSQKLKELELVRNTIAHNRVLHEKETNRLRLYADDLLSSLGITSRK